MPGSVVRSVRVDYRAGGVGKYIADVEAMGAANRQAFSGISRSTHDADQSLDRFDRTARRTIGDTDKLTQSTRRLGQESDNSGRAFRRNSSEIDRYSGRLGLLVTSIAAIGPAAIPISAAAIPAVVGLAGAFGAAAGAAGVLVLATNGIGDALKALDAYQVAPTAANLQKLNETMAALGPSGRQFVEYLDQIEPHLHNLQKLAEAGLLPGAEQGLQHLMTLLPRVRQVVGSLSQEIGRELGDAGKHLAGDSEFQGFLRYLHTDGAPTMRAFATATGDVLAGLTQLFIDLAPANRSFTAELVSGARAFRQWADQVGQTEGFREFLAYIQAEGPRVMGLVSALATALLGVVHAAQPLGDAVLPVLTALLNILAAIGKSPLGPVIFTGVIAMIAMSRAGTLLTGTLARITGETGALSLQMNRLALSLERTSATSAGIGRVATGMKLLAAAIAIPVVANATSSLFGDNIAPTNAKDLGQAVHLHNQNNPFAGGDLGAHNLIDPIVSLLGGTSPNKALGKSLSGADSYLAGLVQNGQRGQAKSEFEDIAASAKKYGASIAEVRKELPSYTAAENAAEAASGGLSAAQADSAQAALKQASALKAATEAALGAFDAETAYRKALTDAAAQAKKSNAGIEGNTEQALANRDALGGLASAWKANLEAMVANGASAGRIQRRFEDAKGAFIRFAEGMGVSARQARHLANQLLEVPKAVTPTVTINGVPTALNDLGQVKAGLDSLHNKQVIVSVETSITGSSGGNAVPGQSLADLTGAVTPHPRKKQPPAGADGMTVPGQRHPYGDKTLILAAPGEEVITNRRGEADAFRRDRAAGRIPRYAGGGTIGAGGTGRPSRYHSSFEGIVELASTTLHQFAIRVAEAADSSVSLTKAQRLAENKFISQTVQKATHGVVDVSAGKQGGLDYAIDPDAHAKGFGPRQRAELLKDAEAYDRAKRAVDGTARTVGTLTEKLSGKGGLNDQLQEAQSAYDSMSSSIQSSLKRELFSSGSTSAFSGLAGAGSPTNAIAQLQGEKRDETDYPSLIQQVMDKGITGPALSEILTSGGISALRQFAAADAGTDQQYASLYADVRGAGGTLEKATNAGLGDTGVAATLTTISDQVAALTAQLDAADKANQHAKNEADKRKEQLQKDAPEQTAAHLKGANDHGARRGAHNAKRGAKKV